MHVDDNIGKWEKRWHPLRQEWVVYAAHRNNRPWSFDKKESKKESPEYDPTCYLCPGNMRVSGIRNPDYKDVYIFENDHPTVGSNSPEIPINQQSTHHNLYRKTKAEGIAKVVCYDPRHNVTLSDVSVDQVAKVFFAWKQEMLEFIKNDKIKYVLIFENKGEIVGVSNPHPHCQIYATDFNFTLFNTENAAVAAHRKENNRNLFADIIEAEQMDECRIIAENNGAIAFIPFFARFAYEVYIFPKKKHATLATMSESELLDLAQVFQQVTQKFDKNFDSSFPYIMVIAQAPVDGEDYKDYHLHLNLLPPLRQPGLMKFLAGPETGAGTFMADTMPEDKATELRNIILHK
jgi:UDPglucose--hexose-1-phosphate uridylyltransferase